MLDLSEWSSGACSGSMEDGLGEDFGFVEDVCLHSSGGAVEGAGFVCEDSATAGRYCVNFCFFFFFLGHTAGRRMFTGV